MEQVTYFTPIPEDECRSLLASTDFGRIAWADDGEVIVLPVNFTMSEGRILFHAAEGSRLATLADGKTVAFQADDVDTEEALGWSVLVQGSTVRVDQEHAPVTWRDVDSLVGVAIEEKTIGGRVMSGTKRAEA